MIQTQAEQLVRAAGERVVGTATWLLHRGAPRGLSDVLVRDLMRLGAKPEDERLAEATRKGLATKGDPDFEMMDQVRRMVEGLTIVRDLGDLTPDDVVTVLGLREGGSLRPEQLQLLSRRLEWLVDTVEMLVDLHATPQVVRSALLVDQDGSANVMRSMEDESPEAIAIDAVDFAASRLPAESDQTIHPEVEALRRRNLERLAQLRSPRTA